MLNCRVEKARKNRSGFVRQDFDIAFIRHSAAGYKNNAEILSSENPRAAFDSSTQVVSDLTGAGIELAKKSAEEFFENMNPTTDKIFFVSSNEARALETANIYRQVAHDRGFEVVKPKKAKIGIKENSVLNEIGDGEIKPINVLSINAKDMLARYVFQPEKLHPPINWDAVDDDKYKTKFEQACTIISRDEQGSWGGNFYEHSADVKEIFPEMKTSKELYNTKFKDLLSLIKWAENKFKISDNNIKILAFGHEDILMEALEQHFKEGGIDNCEMIKFSLQDGEIKALFRGKDATLDIGRGN